MADVCGSLLVIGEVQDSADRAASADGRADGVVRENGALEAALPEEAIASTTTGTWTRRRKYGATQTSQSATMATKTTELFR